MTVGHTHTHTHSIHIGTFWCTHTRAFLFCFSYARTYRCHHSSNQHGIYDLHSYLTYISNIRQTDYAIIVFSSTDKHNSTYGVHRLDVYPQPFLFHNMYSSFGPGSSARGMRHGEGEGNHTENGQGRSLTRGTGLPSPRELLQEECQMYPLAQQTKVIKPHPIIRLCMVDHIYDLKVSYT